MKTKRFLITAAALVLTGCYGHGGHMHGHAEAGHAEPAKPTRAADNAAACARLRAAELPASYERLDSQRIRLLNWNAEKHLHDLFHSDLINVVSDADLILLQESIADEGHLEQNTPFHWSFAPGYVRNGVATGVMTASHVQPVESCRLSSIEPWLGSPKATSIARYGLSDTDETLMVINTHLINFTLGVSAIRGQLQDALQYADRHNGPVIFAGDLNTWNRRRARIVDESLRGVGLRPVRFRRDVRTRIFGKPVDHIYVRGLEAVSADTYNLATSDHNPMDAVLRMKNHEHR